jgi:ATP-dependent RNA helicase DHX37/DHR1
VSISGDAVAEVEKKAYIPVRTEEPIGPDGRVLRPLLTREEQNGVMRVEEGARLKNRSCLNRDPRIQAARLNLPVCGMEQEIVEAITLNDVVILCGETGSGKSTQVPQFLFEAGFGNSGIIGITQPRRVAATSTAERVGVEMGEPINSGFYGNKGAGQAQKKQKKSKKNKEKDVVRGEGQEGDEVLQDDCVKQGGLVGYQIRFDASTVGEKTKIKFMTDGILLREVTSDLLLRQYSVILLDEAHERNVNTDILLGMISR